LISGRVLFRAFASAVWHSWRNWSNGFCEIMNFFLRLGMLMLTLASYVF
jgi:hypothetical protein